MNNKLLTLLTIVFLISLLSCTEKVTTPQRDLYFFYMELCPSCDEYVMAEGLSETVNNMVKKNKSFSGEAFNIILDEHAKKMKEILTEKNLEQISHVLPLLVVDEEYFVGYEEISDKITELKNNQ